MKTRHARGRHDAGTRSIASRQARFAAADALCAIEQREDANEPLTPEFVHLKLDQQEQLAQAAQPRSRRRSATTTIALAALERAKGTLLRYNNIVMEEAPLEQQTATTR